VLALALVVLLGVAAVVAASNQGGSSGGVSTTSSGRGASHSGSGRTHSARAGTTARQRSEERLDSREISAALRFTPFIAAGTRRRRLMALTFDDGPSPYTPAIVRILARMHVPATFFVVGQQLSVFPAAFRDEVAHGFEIGDHTQNHAWLAHLSATGQYAQIHDDVMGIEHLGGPTPRLFRPPYGIYNGATLSIVRKLHMLMVMWSIDPGDWRRPGAKSVLSNVLVHSKPGAIVIMHDGGGDRSQTIAALPGIIRGLRKRGYRLVSLPDLLTEAPPPRHQKLPQVGAA
jgi:peptidoglycan/xylan/chitin deacetylase (PgdA/CDA1 family)